MRGDSIALVRRLLELVLGVCRQTHNKLCVVVVLQSVRNLNTESNTG
jgi:hypothetical protein